MRSIICVALLLPVLLNAQAPHQPHAAEIKLKLEKLNFLGSVLYVAAHPDDENTRVITYFSKGKLATTAYLSMTRGDGGQNLIGSEIEELLGLIRTQELLAARRLDGGTQFFTRANDFGFSKSADETFKIWGKDEILSDVIRVYRQYQPDVIFTRFPPTQNAGHGHHTASAMLAIEAFDAAAKKEIFPDQLTSSSTWQPRRLFINTGRFFFNSNVDLNENTPGITTVNVGGYSPLLGESYSEIAATSRSQHKSQGFGSRKVRGNQPEFFELVKGEAPGKDVFDGVNTSWTRLKSGEKVKPLVERVIKEFNPEVPAASIPLLFQIRKEINALESSVWKTRKLAEVNQLIEDCAGLYIEVTANNFWVAPGEQVIATVEMLNRSDANVEMLSLRSSDLGLDSVMNVALKNNIPVVIRSRKNMSQSKDYSDPYWLRDNHSTGLFSVKDQKLIGKPENDPAVHVVFTAKINGEAFEITKPIVFRSTDPVKGEVYRPFEVVPRVFVNISNGVWLFSDESPKDVEVVLKSATDTKQTGKLKLELPAGWRSEPASQDFELTRRGEELAKTFKVYPSKAEFSGNLKAVAEINNVSYSNSLKTISYDHIPTQTLLPAAEARIIRVNIKKEGGVIGYINGAGDDVPTALRNMGYEVWEMKNEEVTPENLKRVDAVVLGIRALNTNERVRFMMNDLLEYVNQGGTMVVQYNTNNGILTDKFSPYPLTLSRDRTTEEDAEVRILKPDHPLLNTPNKINSADFDGWIQERGLYFPNKWDPNFEALLSMNDAADKPQDGSLLVAKYGNGYYVYTGLSFFRELPDGVPGAFKLFANIVSLGKPKKLEKTKVKTKSK
ncbi:MAG TPA: PIG-L family deacetylase [Cyclobacteriaceae bacterium]|nr:PIG-L family deacetylase [Cyclobacteriaceae bacterium]